MGGRRSPVNASSAASGTAGAAGPLGFCVGLLASASIARRGILPFFIDIAGDLEFAVAITLAINGFVLVDPAPVARSLLLPRCG